MKIWRGLAEVLLLLPLGSLGCFSAPPNPTTAGKPSLPEIVNTFSLIDDSGGPFSRCYEVRPPPLPDGAEEDEVELWYPTRRRAFLFEGVEGAEGIPSGNDGAPLFRQTDPVTVRQTSFGCGKLGSSVWPSSVALCLHLAAHPEAVRGRRVLELGAGCGLPSLLCRDALGANAVLATDFWELDDRAVDGGRKFLCRDALGANAVLATDFWELDDRVVDGGRKEPIPARLHGINLEHNVRGEGAQVQRVDWHDPVTVSGASSFGADLIIGSDLVYYPSNVQPLMDTLQALLEEGRGAPEAFLISPLPPEVERTSLPEFREKLPSTLAGHSVQMDEIVMHRAEDSENQRFLRIAIAAKK
eukprot:CAMPEP_0113596846 /NCGR_PEP_ID=MMETSP0015_2-20120614/40606_1 /TAXON_ID=2838 /ORGANISM="Odontella" /LENGTH=356 /DNA_ID=CAMNT_0000504493 /DNA_START=49 /DNA_END=1119 /DNA_ORIENTATION=- /assembly_acc=CAM_ASM_000160